MVTNTKIPTPDELPTAISQLPAFRQQMTAIVDAMLAGQSSCPVVEGAAVHREHVIAEMAHHRWLCTYKVSPRSEEYFAWSRMPEDWPPPSTDKTAKPEQVSPSVLAAWANDAKCMQLQAGYEDDDQTEITDEENMRAAVTLGMLHRHGMLAPNVVQESRDLAISLIAANFHDHPPSTPQRVTLFDTKLPGLVRDAASLLNAWPDCEAGARLTTELSIPDSFKAAYHHYDQRRTKRFSGIAFIHEDGPCWWQLKAIHEAMRDGMDTTFVDPRLDEIRRESIVKEMARLGWHCTYHDGSVPKPYVPTPPFFRWRKLAEDEIVLDHATTGEEK